MSRIILASNSRIYLQNTLDQYFSVSLKRAKVLYITTGGVKARETSYIVRQKETFSALEITYEEYDIANHSQAEITEKLSNCDIVHLEGGNPYYLIKVIREKNFAKLLQDFLDKGGDFISTSAGTYVMCPSIIMAAWPDRGQDHFGVTDLTAMNFVPFLIKCHYVPEKKDILLEQSKTSNYPLRVITDDQAIVVEGEKNFLIGAGEEIVLE